MFDSVIARGELVKYAAGDVIADPGGGAAPGKANRDGIWLVVAGLVKSSFKTPDGQTQVRNSSCPRPPLPHRVHVWVWPCLRSVSGWPCLAVARRPVNVIINAHGQWQTFLGAWLDPSQVPLHQTPTGIVAPVDFSVVDSLIHVVQQEKIADFPFAWGPGSLHSQ